MPNNKYLAISDYSSKVEDIIKIGLRSVASSVPVAASIATAWSEWESINRWKRIEGFFNTLKKDLKIRQDRMDKRYLRSEEAPHLISVVIDKVQREHRESKRKRFSNFLAESMAVGDTTKFDLKRFFLESLDMLDEFQIRLLKLFRDEEKAFRFDALVTEMEVAPKPSNWGILISSLARLELLGFISETDGKSSVKVDTWMGDRDRWDNRWRNRFYEIVPLGREFLEFI